MPTDQNGESDVSEYYDFKFSYEAIADASEYRSKFSKGDACTI